MDRFRCGRAVGLTFALLMSLAGAPVRGDLIRYDFAGSIDEAAEGTGVVPGTRFSGSFTVDDSAPATYVRLPNGNSDHALYSYGTHRETGLADETGFSFHLDDGRFNVHSDGLTASGFTFYPSNGGPGSAPIRLFGDEPGEVGGPGADYGLSLYLTGNSRLLPDGGGSFPGTLNLGAMSEAMLILSGRLVRTPYVGGDMPMEDVFPQLLVGRLDEMTATPVPEPTWAVAVLLAAAVWVGRLRGAA